jgi:CO/xanthine dehydrogenase FAD-binding subunit
MRAYVPEYDLVAPDSLPAVLRLMASEPGAWRPIAGGTDLMVLFEAGKLPYRRLVSLWGIDELCGIAETRDSLSLGALTTYTELRNHEVVRREFPLLAAAASWTGGIANQNRGTLAGNIVNASPAADSLPALLVYEAEIELLSERGTRRVKYVEFHTGYKTNVMAADEIVSRILLPRSAAAWTQHSRKTGTRKAQAISKVCLAGLARMNGSTVDAIRIALGSVAPTPIRCYKTEAALVGKILDGASIAESKKAIAQEIAPITDIRSTADYRSRVTENLLDEFLERLLG